MSKLEETMALHLRAVGIEYERELRFHPVRRWRFDFAWPDKMVALEIEGGTWGSKKSRHTTGKGFEKDCQKYNEAMLLGWKVYRATGKMVNSGEALQIIERALK